MINPKNSLWVFLSITTFLFIFSVFDQQLNPIFQYKKNLLNPQYWRLITTHFVHLNQYHLLLNVAGFLIAWLMLPSKQITTGLLLSFFLFSAVFCSVSLYIFSPNITTYVGFSGVLHGFFILVLILKSQRQNKYYLLLVFGIISKIILEQTSNYSSDYLQTMINGNVVVDVHLYGVISGLIFSILFLSYNKLKAN